MNEEIEELVKSIDLGYRVGYGMSECGGIMCYEDWKYLKGGWWGKGGGGMEVKILRGEGENIVGEIVWKGGNVMLGY